MRPFEADCYAEGWAARIAGRDENPYTGHEHAWDKYREAAWRCGWRACDAGAKWIDPRPRRLLRRAGVMFLTDAQARLLTAIRNAGDNAEYWPIVNDWVKDKGPARSLALRNINRTVNSLIKAGVIAIDEDGLFQLLEMRDGRA